MENKPDMCLGMNHGKMSYRIDGMVLDGPDAWLHLRRIGMSESAADRMKGTTK